MASPLASHGCGLRYHVADPASLGFSRALSNAQFSGPGRSTSRVAFGSKKRLLSSSPARAVQPRAEPGRLRRINGEPSRMVPTTELARRSTKELLRQEGSRPVPVLRGARRRPAAALVGARRRSVPRRLEEGEGEQMKVEEAGFAWARGSYNQWQRTADVWAFLLSLNLRVKLDAAEWTYPGGFTEEKQRARWRRTASWLRDQVLQLGPTFIKLGQLFSTRSDLLPKEFVGELAKLQDRVPAFSPARAKGFIEAELGAPVDVLFKEFEDRPIAAASLGQILKTGFFHADPHPGNLAIDTDGSLVYYDFGMMGEIKSFTQERLLELFFAVYEKDTKKVLQSLINLEVLRPTGDMTSVRRTVQFFMDHLMNQRPDQQQTFSAIGEDLFAIASDQPISFPSSFTFVMKAFSTIEGIGYTLDPEFSFARIAAPYVQELIDTRQKQRTGAELVEEITRQTNDARDHTLSMPYRIQQIEEFMRQLESGDLKLRVRVLESERAAQKASIMQMATIYSVLGGTLLHVGMTLNSQGNQHFAGGSFIGAGIMLVLAVRSTQRVQNLNKLEKMF